MTFPTLQEGHLRGAKLFSDRKHLIRSLTHAKHGRVAEMGIADGEFSQFIIDTLAPKEFVAFDSFAMHQYPTLWGKPTSDVFQGMTHLEYYQKRFARYGAKVKTEPGISHERLAAYPDAHFDVIYIDGRHTYEQIALDASMATIKLKRGGTIVFNDYIMADHYTNQPYGVVQAVNELVVEKNLNVTGFALQRDMFCDIAISNVPVVEMDLELLSHFESIGDNCEFGFVQRKLGYEEGGFFRWARIHDLNEVNRILQARFEGIYQRQNLIPKDYGMMEDSAFPIQYHTAVSSILVNGTWKAQKSLAEQDAIFEAESRKVRYLAQKFLETIGSQRKIYVLKQNKTPDDEIAKSILRSLRSLGDASLLFVVAADSNHAAGTVELIGANLYKGYIDRFAEYHLADDVSLEVWKRIMETTWDLHTKPKKRAVSISRLFGLSFLR